MERNDFFTKPIADHSFSDGFTTMCLRLHFRNLREILAWPVCHLLKLHGFTYHHYHELWKYMDKNDYKEMVHQ